MIGRELKEETLATYKAHTDVFGLEFSRNCSLGKALLSEQTFRRMQSFHRPPLLFSFQCLIGEFFSHGVPKIASLLTPDER